MLVWVYVHVCGFKHPVTSLGNNLPATGFLLGQAYKALGGSEGCSSQGSPQGDFPRPQQRSQQPRPWSTAGSCRDCCSTETETVGRSCCSRWGRKRAQVCSPRALCWWQQEYPGWPSVPLERTRRHGISFRTTKFYLYSLPTHGLHPQDPQSFRARLRNVLRALWPENRRVSKAGVMGAAQPTDTGDYFYWEHQKYFRQGSF